MQPPVIEIRNVTKKYYIGETEQSVLKGINLTVNSGELVAIMGASGSGKSTLMNIIGLLDSPSTGQYILNGRDITTLTDDERSIVRNEAIGFVFQQFFLLPRLTIMQNVGLPLHYRHCEVSEIHERATHMLSKVGLANHLHHKPNQLSGGQQQRAAIARALIGHPAVILADEPTGALDSSTGKMILDMFLELNQKDYVTIIIVTHDPHVAEQCQRTVRIQDGLFVDSL